MQLPPEQQANASELNQRFCSGEIPKQQFLETVARLTNRPYAEVEKVIDNDTGKNRQLLDYMAELRASYKIGMLSNVASNWIRDHLLTDQEQQLFNDMIFSYEVGLVKPDPRIYQLAAARLQVNTSECVFVDDIERYVQAAMGQGMKGIWYRNFEQFRSDLSQALYSE